MQKIYAAHGSNASWKWLETIPPCIDILRQLATQMHHTVGSHQGILHRAPDLKRDIVTLINSLEAHEVHTIKPGRKVDEDDEPAADAITEGVEALIAGGDGSHLAAFNTAFKVLQQRMAVPVVTGLPSDRQQQPPTRPPSTDAGSTPNPASTSSMRATEDVFPGTYSQDDTNMTTPDAASQADDEAPDSNLEILDKLEQEDIDDEELSLDDAADVALEMDLEETLVEDFVADDE